MLCDDLDRWEGVASGREIQEGGGHMYVLDCTQLLQSCPTLCDPLTVAHQAPTSMGFSRQEYKSGLPFPPPGDLPDSGFEPTAPASPALQADSLLLSHQGSPDICKLMADSCCCTTETNTIW